MFFSVITCSRLERQVGAWWPACLLSIKQSGRGDFLQFLGWRVGASRATSCVWPRRLVMMLSHRLISHAYHLDRMRHKDALVETIDVACVCHLHQRAGRAATGRAMRTAERQHMMVSMPAAANQLRAAHSTVQGADMRGRTN